MLAWSRRAMISFSRCRSATRAKRAARVRWPHRRRTRRRRASAAGESRASRAHPQLLHVDAGAVEVDHRPRDLDALLGVDALVHLLERTGAEQLSGACARVGRAKSPERTRRTLAAGRAPHTRTRALIRQTHRRRRRQSAAPARARAHRERACDDRAQSDRTSLNCAHAHAHTRTPRALSVIGTPQVARRRDVASDSPTHRRRIRLADSSTSLTTRRRRAAPSSWRPRSTMKYIGACMRARLLVRQLPTTSGAPHRRAHTAPTARITSSRCAS